MRLDYMNECPPILREFFGYIESVQGKSEKTANEYFVDLRTFFRYLKLSRGYVSADTELTDICVDDITIEHLRAVTLTEVFEYMNYLASVRGNGAAARSRKCSSIRALFNYLTNKTNQLSVNPVLELSNPKLKKSLPVFLSLEQSIDLLYSCDGSNSERDFCIITLFLNCGMRLSELVGINISDILSDGRLRITGKGNKQRILYLNQSCVDAISAYMRVRPKDGVKDRDALFLSARKQRISPKTVQHVVKTRLSEAEINQAHMSVHKLRHTAATLMYDRGNVDIRALQDILGHENLGTTQIYTHVSSERMKAAAEANPLSKIKKKKSKPTEEE